MTELEKAALEVYPKNISYSTIIDQMFDYNAEKRNIWIDGAEWMKEQIIDKACEFLKSYRRDYPDGIGYIAGIVDDETIEEFKRYMEK